jgi:hypothetical protein
MKEDFLHYIWKFKKFNSHNLRTYSGEEITIINSGQHLQLAGPDFFNAQIIINNQKWAGNVEIHLKSSDWYQHHHETDPAYNNVILHVVWEHDTNIFTKSNTPIPVLEIKNYVDTALLENYNVLLFPKSWIYCEKQIASTDSFILNNWKEKLFYERLERKVKPIQDLLTATNNDWEAVLFCLLAKNFGLNTNGDTFLKIAQRIPFSIIRKETFEVQNLEALLLGNAGLLDVEKEDNYYKDLKFRFYYLLHKYQLERDPIEPVQFFKHRPDNFPTVRLSQLANLYYNQQNLFSKVIASDTISSIYEIFNVTASDYWQTHYQFDKESPKKRKALSKAFIDLLVINTIVPLQFAYAKSYDKEAPESVASILHNVAAENNAVINKFLSFGIHPGNAFETQSLLQLKNEYCNKSRCLECEIGVSLLKSGV